jgi:hypothetical protein
MRSAGLAAAQFAWALLVPDAYAQASACERLKLELGARIDPSIRGYALDDVPAKAPVPPGAKVIGTCEGGARKIVFRRSGSAPAAAASVASAVVPASAPQGIVVAKEPVVAMPPPPASNPAVLVAAPPVEAASSTAAPIPKPQETSVEKPAPAGASLAQRAAQLWARYWRHILAVPVVLLVAGWLWAWIAHRRAYDAAGLPRGPKLN